MRKEILIVGFACLSLVAVAQSKKPSGQASNASKTVGSPAAAPAQAAKPAPAGKSADRESSSPSVSEVTMTKPNGNKTHAVAGDVNNDGHADAAAASGHPTGKRQHSPAVVMKKTDAASTKLSQ